MTYNIVTAGIGHRLIDADVLASPRLIDEGTRRAVEAYKWDTTSDGRSMWRVRDDKFDPPGTEYVSIMVDVQRTDFGW